ncbi:MAG: glycoside hydrolase family 43 protein [Treponemataceae bacterium]
MPNDTIINPILRGFNPDPSILRVGDDYYIAVSTFEWFPGVVIHHSRDLVNWRILARPLDRSELLDMRGNPPSGGVWAPCLSYADGLFYLIYSDAKAHGRMKDVHNYVTTAPSATGPWSAPTYLNSSGFDPSLFHDEDGKSWLLNMLYDHRPGRNRFAGIVLQEFDRTSKSLKGNIRNIFPGTALGFTEGPHLYRHNGLYYLMCAEGGTALNHAVTVARASSIGGPYEVDPHNPMLTSADSPTAELQKAGHASLVETSAGEAYIAHLCGRPIARKGRCTLGRETALQKVEWSADGWLRLCGGGSAPRLIVEAPGLPPCPWPAIDPKDDFDSPALGPQYQTPRYPIDPADMSLSARPGYLRLVGRESPVSRHRQSLVARRVQEFRVSVSTCVEFDPEDFQQMAGLILLYDTENFFYLRVSRDEKLGKCVGVLSWDRSKPEQPGADVRIDGMGRCFLKAEIDHDLLRCYYGPDGEEWKALGPVLDVSRLSDEYCAREFEGAFTGMFAGIACQDLSGRRKFADFDFFEYREN